MDLPTDRQRHRGCFDAAMARAVGWSRAQRETALRRGDLQVLRRGVYLPTEEYEALDERGRHLALIAAEQLALGREWHAARRSAAMVYEIPLIGKPPTVAQLLAARSGTRAGTRGRDRHRRVGLLAPGDTGTVEGMPVVSPQRTICDIARLEDFRNGVVAADNALRRGLAPAALETCLAPMARWTRIARAREVVAFADGLSESPLESLSRCAIHDLGLPAPELQVEIWCGHELVARTDFLWRAFNAIGEADGFGKYGDTDSRRADAWQQQKRRTEWLEDLGFEVAHWGWTDAWRPRGVLDARLLRAFARGSAQTLDPRVRFVPTAVRGLRAA